MINISDNLSELVEGDEHLFAFPEGYNYQRLDLPGMEYAIGVEGKGRYYIHMMRSLRNPVICRWYPEKAKKEAPAGMMPDFFTYQSEEIHISTDSIDIGTIPSMYREKTVNVFCPEYPVYL